MAAPRIVVLDNDATTGSYFELFAWYDWLLESRLASHLSVKELGSVFARILETGRSFRPWTGNFLRRLAALKHDDRLDYVVIYTNQSERADTPRDVHGIPLSVPRLLETAYNRLAGDNCLIDLLLVRPHEFDRSNKAIGKNFKRVFEGLELGGPYSARNLLFFDDLEKGWIDGTSVQHSRSAHVVVEPYTKDFSSRLFYDLMVETIRQARRRGLSMATEERAYGLIHTSILHMAQMSRDEPKYVPPKSWTTYVPHLELFDEDDN